MTYGNGMIATLLPIENPPIALVGNPQLVLITNCPICGFYYACKNLLLHHVVALTTCFACLYIWKTKPLFVLLPLVGSLWIQIGL
jgi:hypothetical protein